MTWDQISHAESYATLRDGTAVQARLVEKLTDIEISELCLFTDCHDAYLYVSVYAPQSGRDIAARLGIEAREDRKRGGDLFTWRGMWEGVEVTVLCNWPSGRASLARRLGRLARKVVAR